MTAGELWRAAFRVVVGAYWLWFASTKWTGLGWTRAAIHDSAAVNPVPVLHGLLVDVVAPNWYAVSLLQTVGETVAGVLLVAGLATRAAGVLGVLLSAGLAVAIAPAVGDAGFRWLYYLGLLVNLEVVAVGPGRPALQDLRVLPAWLRW